MYTYASGIYEVRIIIINYSAQASNLHQRCIKSVSCGNLPDIPPFCQTFRK
ncbi:hypothetical protein HMPREF1548_05133 [Clostridium sp. KLE 1755]|nr:hypothetical protein HMPREF1548_05133 [Clostridium sp. KLE 1755]